MRRARHQPAARRYDLPELEWAFEFCLGANLQMISSQLDARLILSQLIGRLTARKQQSLSP